MNILVAFAIVLGLIMLSVALGFILKARNGRLKIVDARGQQIVNTDVGSATPFGSRGTLLQLSTEFCSPCRAASRILGGVARDGLVHVEVDLTSRPDLAHRFNILSTPTTLILDGSGFTVGRILGPPRAAEVANQLDLALGATHGY
jgi:thiol-disulfide isomerase/thioredoxin